MYVKRLFYSNFGRILISILLGFGLATLFRKFCDGKNCYDFIGPEQNAIRDQVFSFDTNDNECFVMREKATKCNNKAKTIKFA